MPPCSMGETFGVKSNKKMSVEPKNSVAIIEKQAYWSQHKVKIRIQDTSLDQLLLIETRYGR